MDKIIQQNEPCIITYEVKGSIEETQLLLDYIAEEGIVVSQEALATVVISKHLVLKNQWSPEAEIKFWIAYNQLANDVKPVNLESLKATRPPIIDPSEKNNKNIKSPAIIAVNRYRWIAVFTLMLLLVAQIYWLVGAGVTNSLKDFYDNRQAMKQKISQFSRITSDSDTVINKKNNPELANLWSQYDYFNQNMNANYEILLSWNRIWQTILFIDQFDGKASDYNSLKLTKEVDTIKQQLSSIEKDLSADKVDKIKAQKEADKMQQSLHQLALQHALDKIQNKLFLTLESAKFVLTAFQMYFLPLLYGLLGAVTYVLRMLSIEIKQLTYSNESEIKYRLRLSLGALAGMAIGWFLLPDSGGVVANVSPFALAFLVGYNVELLFSVMDKMIDSTTKKPTADHPS